jgi:hypothetical protein
MRPLIVIAATFVAFMLVVPTVSQASSWFV